MVNLEEVKDEEFEKAQPGPIEDEDDDFVDTDSSLSSSSISSSDENDDPPPPASESLTDRLLALRDILPPQTRRSIAATARATSATVKSLGLTAGKGLWFLSTSTVLVMVPYALAYVEEQQIMEQEKEMRAQERLQNEMTPGVGGGGGEARPAGL